jgi:putative PIG3 family NAD(P)H quinone oxidoreductase
VAAGDLKNGDKVFALLPGGGYAEYTTIPEDMAMPIPHNISFEEAAAIPEAFLTAYQALIWLGNLQEGHSVLIHAGASGVGTAAIQLVKYCGSRAIITAGSQSKLDFCQQLGAEITINYNEGNFTQKVKKATNDEGVNTIVDFIGAPYLEQNLDCLAKDGRIVILATMGGKIVKEFNIGSLFQKRAQLITSALRSRSPEYKIQLTKAFSKKLLGTFEEGKIKAVVDKIFDWQQASDAHQYMEDRKNMGKIVLNGM